MYAWMGASRKMGRCGSISHYHSFVLSPSGGAHNSLGVRLVLLSPKRAEVICSRFRGVNK